MGSDQVHRMGSGKPRGIRCARKLRVHRRNQRWADKRYKKKHLGTALKCNPFGGSSHAKGIVTEKVGIEAKQPNSAIRKSARVQLIKNGKKTTAFVPRDGCLNFVEENDEVLVAGFVPATPRVIFPVCVSRSQRLLVSVCGLSSARRRRSLVHKLEGHTQIQWYVCLRNCLCTTNKVE